jgi:nucleoside-diphosphate-sugar epimerase
LTPRPGAQKLWRVSVSGPALVTGASGFIGRRLVARLCADGVPLRALVLPGENVVGVLPAAVEIFRGDVTDAVTVCAAARGAGSLFHLAAVVSDWGAEDLHRRVTVEGTSNVLSAVEPATRVVLASSVVVYGDALRREVCTEDLPWGRPVGAYSRSKQAQERLAWELAHGRRLALTVVRPSNVYGPGSKPWVHDVVAQLRKGLPSLLSGGAQNAGLCHVDNVVDLLMLAASSPAAAGRAYNACDALDVTWRRYFSDLATMVGAPPPRSIPWVLAKAGATVCEPLWRLARARSRPPLTHEALNLVGSDFRIPIDRARDDLGWAPRVSYEEGMASVAAYLRELAPA